MGVEVRLSVCAMSIGKNGIQSGSVWVCFRCVSDLISHGVVQLVGTGCYVDNFYVLIWLYKVVMLDLMFWLFFSSYTNCHTIISHFSFQQWWLMWCDNFCLLPLAVPYLTGPVVLIQFGAVSITSNIFSQWINEIFVILVFMETRSDDEETQSFPFDFLQVTEPPIDSGLKQMIDFVSFFPCCWTCSPPPPLKHPLRLCSLLYIPLPGLVSVQSGSWTLLY